VNYLDAERPIETENPSFDRNIFRIIFASGLYSSCSGFQLYAPDTRRLLAVLAKQYDVRHSTYSPEIFGVHPRHLLNQFLHNARDTFGVSA
jgi:hypothetical protein